MTARCGSGGMGVAFHEAVEAMAAGRACAGPDALPEAMAGPGPIARGAAVSLFDPRGRYLGEGTMGSIRGDEARIDVDLGDAVEVGFVVAGNGIDGEMRLFIRDRPDAAPARSAESSPPAP